MGRPPGSKNKVTKVVGSERRADSEIASVQQTWQTDKIAGESPDFAYQFMAENDVARRKQARTVLDRRTGEHVRIPGWTTCTEADDPNLELLGNRPDLGARTDTVLTMGPLVLMKIPKASHEMLLHEADAIPDAMQARIMRGGIKERWQEGGSKATYVEAPIATHPSMFGNAEALESGDLSRDEERLVNRLST